MADQRARARHDLPLKQSRYQLMVWPFALFARFAFFAVSVDD